VTGTPRSRLFLDSNVLIGGFIGEWGLDKGILSICAARICGLILADSVRIEVERNLNRHSSRLPSLQSEKPFRAYREFILLTNPEIVGLPDLETLQVNRQLIRHEADLPVLLSAMAAKPDWLITNNTKHFTPAVAKKTGLRIATPAEFFRSIVKNI
jgi:predicted nucleic acid-binding protein